MKKIYINTSKPYEILLDFGSLPKIAETIKEKIGGKKIVIVSDSKVFKLYGDIVVGALSKSGYKVFNFVFNSGEENKTMSTYQKIVNFLSEHQLSREDILMSLGGGVVGDVSGFAAATYKRGINWVQVPTSLIAMVDSSIGGKVAVNLPQGKNLLGDFYQPSLVFIDYNVLATLPTKEFRNGMGEVIKYSLLDENLNNRLKSMPAIDKIIERCIAIKKHLVEKDEFDKKERRVLNLGHTIGHSIESASNYKIPHGYAVALGLYLISKISLDMGIMPEEYFIDLTTTLKKYGFSLEFPYNSATLMKYITSDKKAGTKGLNLIIPKTHGKVMLAFKTFDNFKVMLENALLNQSETMEHLSKKPINNTCNNTNNTSNKNTYYQSCSDLWEAFHES